MQIVQNRDLNDAVRINMSSAVRDAVNGATYFIVDITKTNETFVLDVEPRMRDPHCFQFQVCAFVSCQGGTCLGALTSIFSEN